MKALMLLNQDPDIDYAEPNQIYHAQFVPNDPYYSSSGTWGQAYDDLWGLKKIRAESAWDIASGSGVVVAVVDTGTDYTHPDLAGNVWVNPCEDLNRNGIVDPTDFNEVDDPCPGDSAGNGKVDDVRGWDTTRCTEYDTSCVGPKQPDNDPMDGYGHGTHVSGIIGAVGNNALGTVGMAWTARVMPVKGLADNGSGAAADLADAIYYAAEQGAHVINASWGGVGENQTIADAIRFAQEAGSIFVAAAGNENQDAATLSPANIASVITVAATTQRDEKASFSNWGKVVDVAAPGGGYPIDAPQGTSNVLSLLSAQARPPIRDPALIVGQHYLRLAGTSMAAPHVSGLAALVYGVYGHHEVEPRILCTASELDTKNPQTLTGLLGFGRVDAHQALSAGARPCFEEVSFQDGEETGDGDGVIEPGERFTLVVEVKNIWVGAQTVSASLGTASSDVTVLSSSSLYGSVPRNATRTNSNEPFLVEASFAAPRNQTILFELTLTTELGSSQTLHFLYTLGALRYHKGWPQALPGALLPTPGVGAAVGQLDIEADREIVAGTGAFYSPTIAWKHTGVKLFERSGGLAIQTTPAVISRSDGEGAAIITSYLDSINAWDAAGRDLPGWPKTLFTDRISTGSSPLVSDINRDGREDVVVRVIRDAGNGLSNWVYAWDREGNVLPGVWPVALTVKTPDEGATPVAIDLDGDGDEEVITVTRDGYVQTFRRTGVEIPRWSFSTGVANALTPAVGDLNGDGTLEVVATFVGGALHVYGFPKDGSPYLMPGWPKQIRSDLSGFVFRNPAVLADLDPTFPGVEILVGTTGGEVYAWHYDGSSVEGWPAVIGGTEAGISTSPLVVDYDGDGEYEVIAGAAIPEATGLEGQIGIWNRSGVLVGKSQIVTGGVRDVLVADVDDDGALELFALSGSPIAGYAHLFDLGGRAYSVSREWAEDLHDSRNTSVYSPVFETDAWAHVGWQMVSIPYDLDEKEVRISLSDLSDAGSVLEGSLFRWNATASRYESYPRDFRTLERGRGYWLATFRATSVRVRGLVRHGGQRVPVRGPGWNLIGVPVDHPVSAASLKLSDGSRVLTYSEAIEAGWILTVATYDPSTGNYDVITPKDELVPWRGYWLASTIDLEVIF